MEIREFAEAVLFGTTLSDKLTGPPGGHATLTDEAPGAARAWETPGRPAELAVAHKKKRKPLPKPGALHDPNMRVRALHAFANHELMALELMAWAVVAYPDAPAAFRRGLAWLIVEEQRHLQLYIDRIDALGGAFGGEPVNDHFWRIAPDLTDPAKWVSALNLTFEQANLDHAPVFAEHFIRVGDVETAELLGTIEEDEVKHVAFGARWLASFKDPSTSLFDAWVANLTGQNDPTRARGRAHFNVDARERARLPPQFIEALRRWEA